MFRVEAGAHLVKEKEEGREMKKSSDKKTATVDAADALREIERSHSEDGEFLKVRTMKLLDFLEWALGHDVEVASKTTSLRVSKNMVWLKGCILENAMAKAHRLGVDKMSIKIDGNKIKISMPCEPDNQAMVDGVLVNALTGKGLYPHEDAVSVKLSKSKKKVTVTIDPRK